MMSPVPSVLRKVQADRRANNRFTCVVAGMPMWDENPHGFSYMGSENCGIQGADAKRESCSDGQYLSRSAGR